MPNPTYGDVHILAALTDISVAYTQGRDVFVASKAIPTIPTVKQADKYFIFSQADWFRSDAQPRAPGTESAGGGFRVSNDVYYCQRQAIHMDVSDPERANADPAINLDVDATEYVTEQILLAQEIDFVNNVLSTAPAWTGASATSGYFVGSSTNPTSSSGGYIRYWSDVASTPIEDLRGEMQSIASKTGRKPNTLIMGPKVWTALADHPDILDRIKYTEKGIVGTDLLGELLDIENVYVCWAVQDSGGEMAMATSAATVPDGLTAITPGFIAGKNALLCYLEPAPGLRKPSAVYKFVWTLPTGAPAPREGARIKRFRMEWRESDRIEGEAWWVFKIVAPALGSYFKGIVP